MTTLGARTAALMAVGRHAVEVGLVQASGGNLSVRVAPGADEFVVTSSGSYLDQLGPDTLTRMRLSGEVLDGDIKPSSEWKLHQQIYLARPDVEAIVHLHPQYAVLVDALHRPIRQLTLDHVAYAGAIGRSDFFPNGSDELATSAAEALHDCDCVVMAHHGSTTVGNDMHMAFRRALNLESAAESTYRLLVLRDETTEFPQDLRATAIHR